MSPTQRGSSSANAPIVSDAPDDVAAEEADVSTALRIFHSPSGNISCAILPDGALCAVGSLDETFVFDHGGPGTIESGAALSPEAGELAPYGTTVSEGAITCVVPRSDEPRGIVCSDSSTGHGFEASRVSSRQHTY
ncbi:MAG: hypothetical protein ACOYD4_15650 [Solirubrobacterales bacterium]